MSPKDATEESIPIGSGDGSLACMVTTTAYRTDPLYAYNVTVELESIELAGNKREERKEPEYVLLCSRYHWFEISTGYGYVGSHGARVVLPIVRAVEQEFRFRPESLPVGRKLAWNQQSAVLKFDGIKPNELVFELYSFSRYEPAHHVYHITSGPLRHSRLDNQPTKRIMAAIHPFLHKVGSLHVAVVAQSVTTA